MSHPGISCGLSTIVGDATAASFAKSTRVMQMSSPLQAALRHALAHAARRGTLYLGLDAWPCGALPPFAGPALSLGPAGRSPLAGSRHTYLTRGRNRSRGCQDQT